MVVVIQSIYKSKALFGYNLINIDPVNQVNRLI